MRDAVVILYLVLLIYIAFYGIHIYWLLSLFLRSRRAHDILPPVPEQLPAVTVQLPIYNEKRVARRLIQAVAAFDWPEDRLEIQVLDDSDDETTDLIAAEVDRLQKRGTKIVHLRRSDRTGFKAGALACGLQTATGELIAVFDADNVPRPDFLERVIGYFADARVGLVQASWSFLNRTESLLCRAQALLLDAHFHIEHAARSRGGLFVNFNGTAGVWRRQTIIDAGGWQADTLTEDLDLSYRAQLAGWRMVFAEQVDVPTELPNSVRAFKSQQFRWTKGAVQTARKILPCLLLSDLPLRVRIGAWFHLTQKSVSVALLLLSALLVPALFYRIEGGWLKVLAIDLPIFIAGTGSMSLFYGLAFKRARSGASWRDSLLLPALTSIGIALAANNALAVVSALWRRGGRFIRTPKSGSDGRYHHSLPVEYRVRFDYTARAEIVLAWYSLTALGVALALDLYFTIPFLLSFAAGYAYFGILSLKEHYA